MDVARLNFSHGTFHDKEVLFRLIRSVDPTLAILADIQGPKIRIGVIEGDGANLSMGQTVIVTTVDVVGNKEKFTINLKNLPNETKPGDPIFINDGLVRLQVDKILSSTEIACTVTVGGTISSKKGVNLPNTELSVRVPTPKDVEDLKLIARLDPEYVAISFVQDASDIQKIRMMLKDFGNEKIKLIAKIERPLALKNIDEILSASDGFMVARGDLGVEIPFEKLIPAQKMMVKKANISGKPVIVATQMLESMVNAPIPTRAEVSDVYNAVEDGADAVMLSAETAAGKFPRQAVEAMERIIKISEDHIPPRDPDNYDSGEENLSEIIGHLVHATGKEFRDMYLPGGNDDNELPRVKVLVLTQSGLSARMVSKYRPVVPVIAATSSERSAREMRLTWGVEPLLIPGIDDEAYAFKKIQRSTRVAIDACLIEEGDTLVIAGNMGYVPAKTNMLVIFKVKDVLESMKDAPATC